MLALLQCMSQELALTDEQPSMDSTAAVRGAADVGGLARPAGGTVQNDPMYGPAVRCKSFPRLG
jgi:hypothetical protein